MADVIAQPSRTVVTAFERTDVRVFMGFQSDLECEIIGLTTRVGEQDLKSFGEVPLESFNIVSQVLIEIPRVDVNG